MKAAIFLFFVFTSLSTQVQSAALIQKRSVSRRGESQNDINFCRSGSVCGWEVYEPYTRSLEYYMASSCKCAQGEFCIRQDDDISISAYVYRCRNDDRARRKNKNRTTRRPSTSPNTTIQ